MGRMMIRFCLAVFLALDFAGVGPAIVAPATAMAQVQTPNPPPPPPIPPRPRRDCHEEPIA
jgi:hypothetical protein